MARPVDDSPQRNLGLPTEQPTAAALREAFDRCDIGISFEDAMKRPALALCIKNLAIAIQRRRHSTGKDRP